MVQDEKIVRLMTVVEVAMKRGSFGYDDIPLLVASAEAINEVAATLQEDLPKLQEENQYLNHLLAQAQAQVTAGLNVENSPENSLGEVLIVGNESVSLSEEFSAPIEEEKPKKSGKKAQKEREK